MQIATLLALTLVSAGALAQNRKPPPPPGGGLPAPVPAPAPPPPTAAPPTGTRAGGTATETTPALPGEKEALQECHKYPSGKKFKWELRGEIDLMTLLNSISPMLCRPFIVPGNIRQSKVTILAPDTMTAPEAYRMFLSTLETMGLTVQPQGKVLKIIESNRARETAIPLYPSEETPPSNDQFVTRMLRVEHADLNDVKTVLDRLRSKDGDITAYAPTNTLVITDLGTNIRRMEQVVKQLDIASGGEKIWTIKLYRVAATEMATMLQSVFNVAKAGAPAAGGRHVTAGAPPPGTTAAPRAEITMGGAAGESEISQIIPDDPRSLLLVVANEKGYQRVLAVVRRLDPQSMLTPTDSASDRVHVVPLENANADDVIGTLGGVGATVSRGSGTTGGARPPGSPAPAPVPSAGGATPGQHTGLFEGEVRIASDRPTNSLVILASGRDYLTVRDLIKKLDIPRRQVFVEATILEISVDKSRQIGVAWHGGSTVNVPDATNQSLLFGGSEPSSTVNSLAFSPAALSGLAAGLRGPPIPNAAQILGLPPGTSVPSFGVFIQLLQNNGDVNVISMPHILTTDNEKATIQVGQNLPFPGSLGGFPGAGTAGTPGTTGLPGGLGFGTSVQRQDVALKLEITPHVNESDFVRLEIDNELSDVSNPNFNGLGPATSKRTVKSVVTIRDQQSIVLGGLIKDRVSESVDKVPLLGDIPILGYLFKHTNKTILKQNLLIILTPYIIKDPADLRRIFDRKVRERREFMQQWSAFRDENDYEAQVDYRRKRGVLEEINQSAIEAEQEAVDLRNAEEALRSREVEGPVEVPYVPPPRPKRVPLNVPGGPGTSTVPAPPPPPPSGVR